MEYYAQWFQKLADEQNAGCRSDMVHDLVKGRAYDECLHMDCKRADGWEKENKQFKGVLSKVVCAFANAEGGIVVWGYDVKPAHETPNKVWRLPEPVSDAVALSNTLNRLAPECTEPTVDDVRTVPVPRAESCDKGYAVTYVAPSDGGPHRAAIGRKEIKDKYFRRRCDRSTVAAHYELEEMFGRRPLPQLSPEVCVMHGGGVGGSGNFVAAWDVWNKGRGTAVGVTLEVRVRCWRPSRGGEVPMSPDDIVTAVKNGHAQLPSPIRSVHQDYVLVENYTPANGKPVRSQDGHICFLKVVVAWRELRDRMKGWDGEGRLCFNWTLGATDTRTQSGAVVLELNDIVATRLYRDIIESNKSWRAFGSDGKTVMLPDARRDSSE